MNSIFPLTHHKSSIMPMIFKVTFKPTFLFISLIFKNNILSGTNSLLRTGEMQVQVEGAPYSIECLRRPIMESKITIPKDLCQGENVENYSACSGESFKEALKQFKDHNKVLMIVIDNSDLLFNFVKKHLKKDFVEYRSWNTGNETKATEWLSNKSMAIYQL